jgi:hypothetical protein
MAGYLERFDALVADLRRLDYIEILRYEKSPPIQSNTLKTVERELGASLAPPIRAFYQQTDGIKLSWRIKPTLSVEETRKLRRRSTDYYVMVAEYIGDPFANIDILPLAGAVFSKKLKAGSVALRNEKVEFGGIAYRAEDFRRRLRPFDLINDEYCMVFVIVNDNGNPPVSLLGEGCSEWRGFAVCDFESYVEMLLVTRGIVEARAKIFGPDSKGDARTFPRDLGDWERRYTPKMFSR